MSGFSSQSGSSIVFLFITYRSRPIVNTSATLTVNPTRINPEEKNCMVTSGNTTIPVSWWVFSSLSSANTPQLQKRRVLPHFPNMHKILSWQEVLIRKKNFHKQLLYFFCIRSYLTHFPKIFLLRNKLLNSSIVGCLFGLNQTCSAFISWKGGERKQTATWSTLMCLLHPPALYRSWSIKETLVYICVLITLRCLVMRRFWWGWKGSTRHNGMGRGWKAFAVAFEWDIVWWWNTAGKHQDT